MPPARHSTLSPRLPMRRLLALATPAALAASLALGTVAASPTAAATRTHKPAVRTATPSRLSAQPNVSAGPARTFAVNSTSDAHDDNPGDGVCSAAGHCTLRAAVEEANADSGLTSIVVGGGTFHLSLGELDLTAAAGMEIAGVPSGPGVTGSSGFTTVTADHLSRVFHLENNNDALVSIRDLVASNGMAPVDGGGNPQDGGCIEVESNAALMAAGVTVSGCGTAIDAAVMSGSGGGIGDDGQLWLLHSHVFSDVANVSGGGVYVGGAADIEDSAINNNTADANGGSFAGGGAVDNFGTLTLAGSDVFSNQAPFGGGLSNRGDGQVQRSELNGNSATAGYGGAVDNETSLSLVDTRVWHNTATGDGGGIFHFATSLTLQRSTVNDNSAGGDGGGIAAEAPGVVLTDDTVTGNAANGVGGGVVAHWPVSMLNVTLAANSGGDGVGARNAGGENPELDLHDSIVAANAGGNCSSDLAVRSLGHNLDSDGSCDLSGPGDVSHRSAHLGPLQANGGPTQTMSLLSDSPAIDGGDSECAHTDQRGVNRPQGAACDMGAFELAPYYWTVASDGGIFAFGGAPFFGSAGNLTLNRPIVGMAASPDGQGYWLVASDGGIFAYGSAGFHGSTGNLTLNKPIVGMAASPDGQGYWLVASDGGVFAFGTAPFFGSTGGMHINQPVVGIGAEPDGQGYFLVASDGGVFAFGSAASHFHGSMGAVHLAKPVVGMSVTPDGDGYWMVASDGGVFAFGTAGFYGSTGNITLAQPVVGMAAAPDGKGYWMVASDGGIFAFGHAMFFGSMGGQHLNRPMVGMAAI